MTRSRASARAAGSAMERRVADYLNLHVSRFIDRQVRKGAKDVGDIANVYHPISDKPIVVEVKDCAKLDMSGWMAEAEAERVNAGADLTFVVFKRRGHGAPGKQWVLTTLDNFAGFLSGERPDG